MVEQNSTYEMIDNYKQENTHKRQSWTRQGIALLLVVVSLFSLFDFVLRNFGFPELMASAWNDLLMLVGFGMLLYLQKDRRLLGYHYTETDLPYVVLMVFGAVTVLINAIPPVVAIDGLRVLGQATFWYLIVFYGLKQVGNKNFFRELVTFMLIAAALVALYGIIQYALAFETPASWIDRDMENIRTRVFSTIGNPNALGGYMAMFLPISISLGVRKGLSLTGRSWYLIIAAMMAFTLLFTFSRGAWIGFAAGMGLLLVLKDKRFLILFLILLILMPIILPDTITNRLFHAFSPDYIERSAEAGRLYYWGEAFERMVDNPIFGTGVGSFGDTVAMRHDMPGAVWVDNHFLKTGAEMGVVGLGIFLWLMASVFVKGYRSLIRVPQGYPREFVRGAIAGLFAVLIQNGTASIFEVLVVGTYFWVLVGMIHAVPLMFREGEGS